MFQDAKVRPMIVVIDTNVFISAAGYRAGHSWQCLVLFAERRFQLAATREILAEYETWRSISPVRLEYIEP
jgi:predicted nucleic acid-binding protein